MSKARSLARDEKAMSMLKAYVDEGKTDNEILELLENDCDFRWSINTIRRARRSSGKKKVTKGSPDEIILGTPPLEVTEKEKSNWYRQQFRKTHLYHILHTQFIDNEVTTYMEEYGHICCQFEDIVVSEFFQIDDFLKHRLLVNRALKSINDLREEVECTRTWITAHKPCEDDEETLKVERKMMIYLLDTKRKQIAQENDRYDKLLAARDKIYQSLSATRKDRIDKMLSSKETFLALVAALKQSEKIREEEGTYAELTRMAEEDISRQWHKPIKFEDGEIEPILLDEHSDLGELIDE